MAIRIGYRSSAGAGLFTQHGLLIPDHHLRQAHILRDKVAYEIESARSEKNRPPYAGALQSACRRVLERHALPQRQPEHRGAVAAYEGQTAFYNTRLWLRAWARPQ